MRVMRASLNNQLGLRSLIAVLPNNLVMAEVGSFSGESAQIFLDSGKFSRVYCIDHWLNLPDMDYVDAERQFDLRFANEPRVIKWKLESQEGAGRFDAESLDFVYIDANHSYESVARDIDLWLSKVKIGGFIGGHDYKPGWCGVVQAVNEKFGTPGKVFEDSSWLCIKM